MVLYHPRIAVSSKRLQLLVKNALSWWKTNSENHVFGDFLRKPSRSNLHNLVFFWSFSTGLSGIASLFGSLPTQDSCKFKKIPVLWRKCRILMENKFRKSRLFWRFFTLTFKIKLYWVILGYIGLTTIVSLFTLLSLLHNGLPKKTYFYKKKICHFWHG